VLLLKLVSDSSQAIVARSAIAFDVRIARIFVSVVHAVAEDTVGKVQYHSALLTCSGHFSTGQWVHADCCRTLSCARKGRCRVRLSIVVGCPLCDSTAGAERRIRASVYDNLKRSSALPQPMGSLRNNEKKRWNAMDRGAFSQIILLFCGPMGPLGPGPTPPRAWPQGPWAHFGSLDGDRRESVCNSAVLGVKTCFTAILCDVGRV